MLTRPLFFSLLAAAIPALVLYFLIPAASGSRTLVAATCFVATFMSVWLLMRGVLFRHIRSVFRTLNSSGHAARQARPIPGPEDLLSATEKEASEWVARHQEEAEKQKNMEMHRKEFLGNVSHELKTPIFNIQGYVTTLLDGGLEDKTIRYEYLKRTEQNVERLITIVEDLVDISQLETGELNLDREMFDIAALAREVIETQELDATARHISLEVAGDLQVAIVVYADKFRIRQVLTNLVVNSIRYGNENGKTVLHFRIEDGNARIEVSDTGIGIAPENINRIFERFYRVDKSRSREIGGTGLGLSIVKHIIEAHGQSINVTSEVGKGTTFSFTLARE